MKKIGIIATIIVLLVLALFLWALSGASEEMAPKDVRTIDVTPAS